MDPAVKLVEGVLWYIVFLFSTTLHEASHALTAFRLGDRTAYEGGQVTLNPIPHMKREPIGTIVVPIISYVVGGWMIGWASVPYNFAWALNYPKHSAKMSLAGPAANLLLVVLSAIAIRLGMMLNIFTPPESVTFVRVVESTQPGVYAVVASFLNVFFSLNLLLCLFNLLPIPPLDGSGIIPFFLSDEVARKYLVFVRHPSMSFIGLLFAWKFFGVIYSPLHLAFVNLLYLAAAHYG